MHQQYRAAEGECEACELHTDRSAVRLLSEQQAFVGRPHESPDDHRNARHHTDASTWSPALDTEQDQPERAVFGALDQRYRYALADLTGVVQSEPLVREVPTAVHHELWSQHTTERPTGDERRHQRVGERGERALRP